jgi:hypothetical protein
MAEKKALHRSKTFYIVSSILLIIFLCGFLFWRNYKYKLVNKKLDALVTTKSKGLYQLSYKNLVINEELGSISAENVDLIPDSTVYQLLEVQHTAPQTLFSIHIPSLTITGVITPKILLNKEISAHIVKISNATIEILSRQKNKDSKSSMTTIMRSDLYHMLSGKLHSIKADSIVIENASLTLKDENTGISRMMASGLSIRFSGVAVDSVHQNDSSYLLFSKNLAIHCDEFKLPFKNKFYNFQMNGFEFNSETRSLHTERLLLQPLLSENAFAKAHKYAVDRLDIHVRSLDIWHIDLQDLLANNLTADSMKITDAVLLDYRDKSRPHDSVDRTDHYPQQAIMKLPFAVYFNKILINDTYIEYKEKNEKSDSSGKVSFYHVQANLENVTNILARIKNNHQMTLHFNSQFLNQTNFKAIIKMRLNDDAGHFTLDAQLGTLNAKSLNPLLKPMALAEINEGNISKLTYHLNATNTTASGNLLLVYDNLSIKLLKKDEDKNKYKTKLLPTLAAGLVLKDSNPKDGKTRMGTVTYPRDTNRSIFNLMWKSLFSAIKRVAI